MHKKPYVTIDCRHDTSLHKYSSINVVSKECTNYYFANRYTMEDVYQLMVDHTDGLDIITSGEKEMIFGRKEQPMKKMKPFTVDVKSTLGAGDTFKAGCIYGLLNNMPDDELVRFASACSAIAISRFPLPLNPQTLDEVNSLLENTKKLIIEKAQKDDLKEILELQYLAYQSEAKLFNDPEIPPLKQTLEDVMQEFEKGIVLKATDGSGAIIGSVRAYSENGDVYIGKLMVHPEKQRTGIGTKLLSAIEKEYPKQRYELFTSTKSVSNIRLYEGLGYKIFKEVPVSEELQFVYLEK